MPCGCSAGGDHHHLDESDDLAAAYGLYENVLTEGVTCLNEDEPDSGVKVLRPFARRLETCDVVRSACDCELLFNFPFKGNIKLKGLMVIAPDPSAHPLSVKLWRDKPNMTFDEVTTVPDQVIELTADPNGLIEYPTKVVKFSSLSHLSLLFTGTQSSETEECEVSYIGLRGDWRPQLGHGVTVVNYESRANPADHKTDADDQVDHSVS